jgi:hypothetical protein
MPAPLVAEVRRVAKQRKLTMSRALVSLAERGIQTDLEAKQNLKAAYKRFMNEQKPGPKEQAGKDLIRAIFGTDIIAQIRFADLPRGLRRRLLDRVQEREISLADLEKLQQWVRSESFAPDGEWYKDFGSSKLCGVGEYPWTVLTKGMAAFGQEIESGSENRLRRVTMRGRVTYHGET